MLTEKFLLEDFFVSGSSLTEFESYLEEIAKHTVFTSVESQSISLLSYFGKNSENGEILRFYRLDPLRCPSILGTFPQVKTSAIDTGKILARGDFEPLINEMLNETRALAFRNKTAFFISPRVFTGRLSPFGLGGDFFGIPSYERDLAVTRAFANNSNRVLVTRHFNGVYKIFSILGARYKPLPQNALLTLYRSLPLATLGRAECRQWTISHSHTSIHIEFPDKAEEFQMLYGLPKKFIPGIYMETSDTGDCSVRVIGTWRVGGSIASGEVVAKKHMGNISFEGILEDAEKAIFAEYTKLPETLCELMTQEITDPSWDLSTPAGVEKNRRQLDTVIRHAFNVLGIRAAISYKLESSLLEQFISEFDPTIPFTAYDIAAAIMGIGDRTEGLCASSAEKLSKAIAKAPYISYNVTVRKEEVILTA